jgi:glycosyltransferase involved in cell wall biosynthesis
MIYLHTDMQSSDGLDLFDICDTIGIDRSVVKFTDVNSYTLGMDNDFMRQLYQAADVLLNPAKAEGFGLPIIEAQACGTPVITVDFSAMTEITELGYCTKPLQSEYNPLGHLWALPSIERLTDALIDCYHNPPDNYQRVVASKVMHNRYNWEKICLAWEEDILSGLKQNKAVEAVIGGNGQVVHG